MTAIPFQRSSGEEKSLCLLFATAPGLALALVLSWALALSRGEGLAAGVCSLTRPRDVQKHDFIN